jgi:hypothetical protein
MEGVGPENHIKLTTCSTEYRNSCSQTHVHKITEVSFFILRWDSMILMGANPVLGTLEGVAFSRALEMDLPPSKSLRLAPYKQQVQ